MPGRHPDDDLLADLAADVLPVEQARSVEAHVLSCDRCAMLLSDAEHVRGLLLADDPGPVPPEVWNRIETALAAQAPFRQLHDDGAGSSLAARERPGQPSATPRGDVEGGRWDGADPLDAPDAWDTPGRSAHPLGAIAPVTGSLRRLTTSRRDARGDRRRRVPSSALLTAAAAVAVAVVVIVGSAQLLGGAGSGGASGGSAALSQSDEGSPASAPAGVRIVSSGTDYTAKTLAPQVRALVPVRGTKSSAGRTEAGRPASPPARSAPQPPATAPKPATVAPQAAAPGATEPPSLAVLAPDPRATDIRNPQRLAACLAALNASAERLVAVDLARFEEREAAVLVLRAPTGGYEIFVVARTCAPGDEGTLDYDTLPA